MKALSDLWHQNLFICGRKGILCGYTYFNPAVHLHHHKGEPLMDYTRCRHGNQCAAGFSMLNTEKVCPKRRPLGRLRKSHKTSYRRKTKRMPRKRVSKKQTTIGGA